MIKKFIVFLFVVCAAVCFSIGGYAVGENTKMDFLSDSNIKPGKEFYVYLKIHFDSAPGAFNLNFKYDCGSLNLKNIICEDKKQNDLFKYNDRSGNILMVFGTCEQNSADKTIKLHFAPVSNQPSQYRFYADFLDGCDINTAPLLCADAIEASLIVTDNGSTSNIRNVASASMSAESSDNTENSFSGNSSFPRSESYSQSISNYEPSDVESKMEVLSRENTVYDKQSSGEYSLSENRENDFGQNDFLVFMGAIIVAAVIVFSAYKLGMKNAKNNDK